MENARKFTVDCSTGYITVAENIRNFLGSCPSISIHTGARGRVVQITHKGKLVEILDGRTLVLSDKDVLSIE